MNENEVMTNEIEEVEAVNVETTNTEIEETSGSGLVVGMAIGAGLAWLAITGVKKAKKWYADRKAKKEDIEGEVFEPVGTEEVVECENVTETKMSKKSKQG